MPVILNIYLYFYPILYTCAFSRPSADTPAPFRLLTLADPQIEGDTTLRRYERPRRSTAELESLSLVERLLVEARDAHLSLKKHAKMLDLWGNDLYLSHVYKTVKRLTYPTHVTVLGDMLGSQWISDDEFQRRSNRYWRIFDDAVPVSEEDVEQGTADDETWKHKLIMMPGNHDVGYAGDISRPRLRRYEKAFGPYNYKLAFHPPANASFTLKEPPELRIAVLNSLTLDTPIWDESLAEDSYSFVDSLVKNRSLHATQATVLLTHLPFHKQHGICVDGPEIIHFPPQHGGGIRSQNFVTESVSDLLKGRIFGVPGGNAKTRGLVMTGHDHEGCQTVHIWDKDGEETRWNVVKYQEWVGSGKEKMVESIREITVRSMMGEFGGNAGLLSAWFDWENNGMFRLFERNGNSESPNKANERNRMEIRLQLLCPRGPACLVDRPRCQCYCSHMGGCVGVVVHDRFSTPSKEDSTSGEDSSGGADSTGKEDSCGEEEEEDSVSGEEEAVVASFSFCDFWLCLFGRGIPLTKLGLSD